MILSMPFWQYLQCRIIPSGFIAVFEKLYGRAPKLEDAEGDFRQVAKGMQISVGAARYYLRLAAEPGKQIDGKLESPKP
jgi:hypothetical protein